MANTENFPDMAKASGRGRPTIYSEVLADQICVRIAAGDSVRKICQANDMPNEETIYRWILNLEAFSKKYRTAREIQQERYLDELIEIADEKPRVTPMGSTDSGAVQHAKLRIDTRKWTMARLAPRKYGDKMGLDHGVQQENPLATLIKRIAGTALPVAIEIPSGNLIDD